jgi:hypothetical protein
VFTDLMLVISLHACVNVRDRRISKSCAGSQWIRWPVLR